MTLAIILFAVTYICIMLFTKYRSYIALASAALFVILKIMPVSQIASSIEWNVILMIGGTMGTVFFFIESKMPALMADILLEKTSNVKWAIVLLSFFSGVISAFMDNAIAASRGLGRSLVPTLIVVVGSCLFRIAWVYTIFAAHRTIPMLYMVYPVSWTLTATAEIIYFVHSYRRMALSPDSHLNTAKG